MDCSRLRPRRSSVSRSPSSDLPTYRRRRPSLSQRLRHANIGPTAASTRPSRLGAQTWAWPVHPRRPHAPRPASPRTGPAPLEPRARVAGPPPAPPPRGRRGCQGRRARAPQSGRVEDPRPPKGKAGPDPSTPPGGTSRGAPLGTGPAAPAGAQVRTRPATRHPRTWTRRAAGEQGEALRGSVGETFGERLVPI